ncbi:MAG: putative Ig domain-containing protein [Candidatus Marinimicrobia bacterium]|nr:putative Ig domain-containing protein [Candidatus Neomarinimicrobiota bacterium]
MMSKHFFSHVILRHILLIPLLVVLSAGSLWGASELRNIQRVVDFGDLDHDGNNDFGAIRKVSNSNSELITFSVSPSGEFDLTWRFALPGNLIGDWVDFTLADLNLNGRPEFVAIAKLVSAESGNTAPWMYGFEWNGTEFEFIPSFQWGWAPENGLYARPVQIKLGDIDRDGLSELIVSLSAPESNLLIIEFNGDLRSAKIKTEFSGLPANLSQIPVALHMVLSDVDKDQNTDILLFQKQGEKLVAGGILSTGEDSYAHRSLAPLHLRSGSAEIIKPNSVVAANLDGSFEKVFLGSSTGNIYLYDSNSGSQIWRTLSEPIEQLKFADLDADGLIEALIRTGNRIYYLEQESKGLDFDRFSSLLNDDLFADNVVAFRDGLLVGNQTRYKFHAVAENDAEVPTEVVESEDTDSMEPETEEPAAKPPLMEKLLAEDSIKPTIVPEVKRRPKTPDIILHVGESFVHNIPRQEEMDPGQAYVKFKTYPEGMRLGKDFVLRWNPAEDQLGYHQISYSFGQSLDTTLSLYVNHLPDIFSTPPPLAQTGQQYLYQVQLEDLNEEQFFEYELITSPSGMQVDEEGLVRWLPSDTQLDSQYVTLGVSDGFERTLQKFTIYVNSLPVIMEKPAPVAFINEPYVGQISFKDKNNPNTARVIPLRAPQNLVMESSGRISWTPEARQTGFFDILFEITDDMSKALDSFTLFANTPPIITSKYDEHVPVGKPWHYNVEVQDPNNNQDISFLLSESSIPNLSISRRGRITWTPTEAELGAQSFTISVSDGLRDDLQKANVYVNSPPVIGKVADTLAMVARPYTTTIPVTDLNKDQTLSFAFLTAPKGMTISPAGQINWTPSKEQKGWNEVFLKVSDKYSSDTHKFAVYANAPPAIVSKPDTMAIAGKEYVYEIKALDLNTDQDLVYKVFEAPKGVFIRNGNVVTWTPGLDQINKAQFKVSVSDGYVTNIQKVDLFVNALPEVTSTPSAVVLTDREYRYQLASRDLNEDKITYSKVLLPSGAVMNEEEGLITWTPDASNEGSNKFIVELIDSRGSSNLHEFEVNVFQDPKTPIRQMGAFLITLAGIGAMFIMKFLY